MVRITGSVKDENSVNAPTDDSLSSVVRRRRGNSAKRISGTESRAPTKNPPTESNAPRKERLLSGDDPDAKEVPSAECSPPSTMRYLQGQAAPWELPAAAKLPGCLLFIWGVPAGKPLIYLYRR